MSMLFPQIPVCQDDETKEKTVNDLFEDEVEAISLQLQEINKKIKIIADMNAFSYKMDKGEDNEGDAIRPPLTDEIKELKNLLPKDKVSPSCRNKVLILTEAINFIKELQMECNESADLDDRIRCLNSETRNLMDRLVPIKKTIKEKMIQKN